MIETIANHVIDDWESMPSPDGTQMLFDDDELNKMNRIVELARRRIVTAGIIDGAPDPETLQEILNKLEEEE